MYAAIVKDCERSQHDPRIAAEGKREDVHRLSARFEILTLLRIFFDRKVHCLRRVLQREIRSHGQRLTLSVIHRHACQALVILETVHNALQFAIGVPSHQRRDRLLQALRQDQACRSKSTRNPCVSLWAWNTANPNETSATAAINDRFNRKLSRISTSGLQASGRNMVSMS